MGRGFVGLDVDQGIRREGPNPAAEGGQANAGSCQVVDPLQGVRPRRRVGGHAQGTIEEDPGIRHRLGRDATRQLGIPHQEEGQHQHRGTERRKDAVPTDAELPPSVDEDRDGDCNAGGEKEG